MERFTARDYVDFHTRRKNITIEEIGVGPVVVISWSPRVVESLASKFDAQTSPHWFYRKYEFYTATVEGRIVSFVQAPVGASGTVMMMEEMIACGAHTFVGLGWAGSLQPSAPVGSLLIPTDCISEEGTTPHYLEHGVTIAADADLATLLEETALSEGATALSGLQWTTDAPHRELLNTIRTYGERGVLGVDMETSAMYALGVFRSVKVCNLLVVSDELWHEWRPAFGTAELDEANELAQRIVARAIRLL